MPRSSRGQERSAVGEIQGDFEANTQVGVGGFSPHGAVLLLFSRGIPATPLSPRQAGGQMVLWEEIRLALVGTVEGRNAGLRQPVRRKNAAEAALR